MQKTEKECDWQDCIRHMIEYNRTGINQPCTCEPKIQKIPKEDKYTKIIDDIRTWTGVDHYSNMDTAFGILIDKCKKINKKLAKEFEKEAEEREEEKGCECEPGWQVCTQCNIAQTNDIYFHLAQELGEAMFEYMRRFKSFRLLENQIKEEEKKEKDLIENGDWCQNCGFYLTECKCGNKQMPNQENKETSWM